MNFPMLPIQGNVVMGLLAAILWGGGDFSGGRGAQLAGGSLQSALRVILFSHATSLCILLTLAYLRGDTMPHGSLLVWGVCAGVTGGLSLACFYIALARGAMGASAAVSGLLAAAVPAIFAIASDGSPGVLHLAGFAIAGIAIWMVAAAPTGVLEDPSVASGSSTMMLAIIAGAGFGLYFIALKMAGAAGVVWPMATARMGSITACSLLLITLTVVRAGRNGNTPTGLDAPPVQAAFFGLPKAAIFWALSTAVLDTCGNMFYISATRSGRLDIAAVLASLYPTTTILLAGIVLKERLSKRQGLGMAIAGAAVVMITL
ncbi:putative membrane protein [Granulicella aggregans]|uniref:Putative membrane protein n=1 Tax=Granulicella aggregans TaxID=474949 RepID=A0A7W7ZAU1_9BACT|nr:DMT family transporter [Granulicella aggregans]MBB5056499.1 putative membrane protein [Granulicella aggregans]